MHDGFRCEADSVETDWQQRTPGDLELAEMRMMSGFSNKDFSICYREFLVPRLCCIGEIDAAVRVQEGKLIATRISSARFIELPSRCHMVHLGI